MQKYKQTYTNPTKLENKNGWIPSYKASQEPSRRSFGSSFNFRISVSRHLMKNVVRSKWHFFDGVIPYLRYGEPEGRKSSALYQNPRSTHFLCSLHILWKRFSIRMTFWSKNVFHVEKPKAWNWKSYRMNVSRAPGAPCGSVFGRFLVLSWVL